jgi:hypothetical protein
LTASLGGYISLVYVYKQEIAGSFLHFELEKCSKRYNLVDSFSLYYF